jgi:hypothetical protein
LLISNIGLIHTDRPTVYYPYIHIYSYFHSEHMDYDPTGSHGWMGGHASRVAGEIPANACLVLASREPSPPK